VVPQTAIRAAGRRRITKVLVLHIRHGKIVGIADDVRDFAIFLDCPRCREAAADII
jgi:hypothetical protein